MPRIYHHIDLPLISGFISLFQQTSGGDPGAGLRMKLVKSVVNCSLRLFLSVRDRRASGLLHASGAAKGQQRCLSWLFASQSKLIAHYRNKRRQGSKQQTN